jgi:hypothetical protein
VKKEGGSALALIFGKGKKGGMAEPEADPEMDSAEDHDIPPDFEDEAIRFMPELEGDPARMDAFWKAVKACVGG